MASRRATTNALSAVIALVAVIVAWVVVGRDAGSSATHPPAAPPAPQRRPPAEPPAETPPAGEATARPDTTDVPPEARSALSRILAGGPFRHRQDGSTFQNRERRLPDKPRGYYREYTVETPSSKDRGARRIITGGDPPTVFYYTDDHYRTFRELGPEASR